MKNVLNDEKLKDKFTDEDKTVIEDTAKEGLQFLESNADASTEEFEAKQKELEAKYNPIMMRVYQAAGGQPGADGMPDMGGMGGMPGGMGGMPGGMPGGMGGMPGGGMPPGGMPGGAPDAGVDDLD
jgi:L1 cell adhesion molecule like protein